MAIPKTTRRASIYVRAFHIAPVDLASTAAEATSAAATVTLPSEFTIDRPILTGLMPGEAAMNDNALLLETSFSLSAGHVVASFKFANNNVAAGAAIDPASKQFWFLQL